MLEYSYAQFCG